MASRLNRVRHELGLDRPFLIRMGEWYLRLLQGDLGTSLLLNRSVASAILERLPVTLSLTALAFVVAVLIGVAAGVVGAVRHGRAADQGMMTLALLGLSIPEFWLGLVLIWLVAVLLPIQSDVMLTPGALMSTHDPKLENDANPSVIGGRVQLVTADLSFISLARALDALITCCDPGGDLVLLMKPQFEAGRVEVSRGRGVITAPEIHRRVQDELTAELQTRRCTVIDWMTSPLTGGDGNREFLVYATTDRSGFPA